MTARALPGGMSLGDLQRRMFPNQFGQQGQMPAFDPSSMIAGAQGGFPPQQPFQFNQQPIVGGQPGVAPPGNTAAGFLGGFPGNLSDWINDQVGQVGEYLGSSGNMPPDPWDPGNLENWDPPGEDPFFNFKPNVKGPDGETWVWDADTQTYVPQDPWKNPEDWWPDEKTEDDDTPMDYPPQIIDGEYWVYNPETNSYEKQPYMPDDPWDPDNPKNWEQDPPPWWEQYPYPPPRDTRDLYMPYDPIAEMWKRLIQQGMDSSRWTDPLNDALGSAYDQQNAYNLRKMIEDEAFRRQQSRQDFLSPLLDKLIGGIGGDGEGGGSGVGPVGAIFRGLGAHSRYVEGGEDEGSGPMTVMNKPREVKQPRRFSGMLPSSTSSRLGAAAPQFAQALGSRGESVRQQAEDAVGRASAGQATQARGQAGQQGLGLSNLVTGMQRQSEALEDAKKRSKRGVLKPLLQDLMGQV